MKSASTTIPAMQCHQIRSVHLNREVICDVYLPLQQSQQVHLLFINDGQNLGEAGLIKTLKNFYQYDALQPMLVVGIHAGEERKYEYGIAGEADYLQRGAKATHYTLFVVEELLPFIQKKYNQFTIIDMAIAGFSLGGLTALDIAWNHPGTFSKAGIFSGSLWWRSLDHQDPSYDDDQHRIMHQHIRRGDYKEGLRFFFQCGNMDETQDRNKNGIIDSIDDTLDMIKELEIKGYKLGKDITYLEMADGRHDIPTWGRAIPVFLEWGWGKNKANTGD